MYVKRVQSKVIKYRFKEFNYLLCLSFFLCDLTVIEQSDYFISCQTVHLCDQPYLGSRTITQWLVMMAREWDRDRQTSKDRNIIFSMSCFCVSKRLLNKVSQDYLLYLKYLSKQTFLPKYKKKPDRGLPLSLK